MSDNKVDASGGIFPALLTVLFIGLKLTGYIDWSWWWVLSPFWLPLAIIGAVVVLIWIIGIIGGLIAKRFL